MELGKDYDFWKIRALLSQGFTVAELRRFCSYEPAFEEILDELPKGEDRKSEVVEELINFAKRRRLIGNVLKWAKRANPRLYGELGPYHRVPAAAFDQINSTETSTAVPMTAGVSETEYDVFISHASEDKEEFVAPFAEALLKIGVRVWYDEFTLKLGDSLSQSIAKGLAGSRYGIVVLSKNFINKSWTRYELQGLWSREIGGREVIIPIWHGVTKDDIVSFNPTLADKLALDTSKHRNLEDIVLRVVERVRPDIYENLLRNSE
jgi:hypothetical protein